jgi:hypothetical protein
MFSSTQEDKIARWNKYKSRMDDAGVQVIRQFLHLVRPTEGFLASSPHEIERSFNEWKEEEVCFYTMTGNEKPPVRVFPKPPLADAPRSCWRMWGLLIQQQVERIDQSDLISNCVTEILASPRCEGECPCKVSTNPWVGYNEVAALGPLNVTHNPRCQCLGYQRCAKKEEADSRAIAAIKAQLEAAEAKAKAKAKAESGGFPYEFCHCGDTQYRSCTCGKPAKEAVEHAKELDAKGLLTPPLAELLCGKGWTKPEPRMAESSAPQCRDCRTSGRGECMECHVKNKSYDERGYLKMPSQLHMLRQAYVMSEGFYERRVCDQEKEKAHSIKCACGVCFWKREELEGRVPKFSPRAATAPSPIGSILHAAAGGNDMAKDIFAAMGTPHDSKCPHGLPFYACMPCSH